MPSFDDSNDWIPVDQVDGLYYSSKNAFWYAATNQTIAKKGITGFLKSKNFSADKKPKTKYLKDKSEKFEKEFDAGSDQQIAMKEHMLRDFNVLGKQETPKNVPPEDLHNKTFVKTKLTDTGPNENQSSVNSKFDSMEKQRKEWEKLSEETKPIDLDTQAISEIVAQNMYVLRSESATEVAQNDEFHLTYQRTRSLWPTDMNYGTWLVFMVKHALKSWGLSVNVGFDKQVLTHEQIRLIALSKADWSKKIKDRDFPVIENPPTPEPLPEPVIE